MIIDPKVSNILPNTKSQPTFVTAVVSTPITAPVTSIVTSVVKTLTPNIHVSSSRIQSVVTSQNMTTMTTTSSSSCIQNTLVDIKTTSSQILTNATVVTSSIINKVIQSTLPATSVQILTSPTIVVSKPTNIQPLLNPSLILNKTPMISAIPFTKSNVVSTISGKPIIVQSNPSQNLQCTIKTGGVVSQVTVGLPLNKVTNPGSPSKILQNVQTKIQAGQQSKLLVMQPQIAHLPQKQVNNLK